MKVRLPRAVRGAELIEVMKASTRGMQNCEVILDETPRYEPGSLKKVVDRCQITVRQTQNNSRRKTGFSFSIQDVEADGNYERLSIYVRKENSWWGLFFGEYKNPDIENNPERFRYIERLIEQFILDVFQKLSAPPVAKT